MNVAARRVRFSPVLSLALLACGGLVYAATPPDPRAFIDTQIAARAGLTGSYVLDRGEEALLARAWLVEHARRTIEVQYFIWSTDNIGTLATEALLRAADRGVRVRVIVDDLLIDAPDDSLLALALHPNIDIRIYNPVHSVGVPLHRRIVNILTDFRGSNQRMHDKTFIVDGQIAITGGRNMADEYFDFGHQYNFRDRDVLVLGAVVPSMRSSFEQFWNSSYAVPVERLYERIGVLQQGLTADAAPVRQMYRTLRGYATSPANFAPEIRATLADIPSGFQALAAKVTWGRVEFLSDEPGKNAGRDGLAGGGRTTTALATLVENARSEVLIQSPYLVLSDAAIELFRRARTRGVRIRISTNSLGSTDNLQAFSGYRNQRSELLAMGLEIFEYRPDPAVRTTVMQRYIALREQSPVFALHAKTMVIDAEKVYVGTFNLDPRSENLNTEVGVVIHDSSQARLVAESIATDMLPTNSWRAAEDVDRYAPWSKRLRVAFWQWMPIKPLL